MLNNYLILTLQAIGEFFLCILEAFSSKALMNIYSLLSAAPDKKCRDSLLSGLGWAFVLFSAFIMQYAYHRKKRKKSLRRKPYDKEIVNLQLKFLPHQHHCTFPTHRLSFKIHASPHIHIRTYGLLFAFVSTIPAFCIAAVLSVQRFPIAVVNNKIGKQL